jgi:putative ABC transport system permease protein
VSDLHAAVVLALRSVTRHRRRSAFAVSAIACGVIATILAGGFIQWIYWATREGTIQSGLGHIEVKRRSEQRTAREEALLVPDQAEMAAMRSEPGVKALAQRRSFGGLASHEDVTVSFLGEGVDPDGEAGFTSVVVKGEPLSAHDPSGALLGEGLAANLGVGVGDSLVLLVSTGSGSVNAIEVRVQGLMRTISKAYDDAAIRIPIDTAGGLLRRSGAQSWLVVLDETSDTENMTAKLREKFGGRFDFVPWHERADFYKKTVLLLSRQMAVVNTVIALVVMLMIANSLLMAVMERRSEIGTCMALGATSRAILAQFSLEAALLGLVGVALGAPLGVLLAQAVSSVGIPMPPPPGQSQAYLGRILVTPHLVAEAVALAVGTAVVAGIVPAAKASRTEIVTAIRSGR